MKSAPLSCFCLRKEMSASMLRQEMWPWRAGDGDGELVAEFVTDELHKLGGVVQVAARACPAERQVAAEGEDVVDTVIEVVLELALDFLARVAHAGEVRDADGAESLDAVKNFNVLADVRAAGAVGAGNVVGLHGDELFQHAALAAQFFHPFIGLRGKNLKAECHALVENICDFHLFLLSI